MARISDLVGQARTELASYPFLGPDLAAVDRWLAAKPRVARGGK
jgi:hypothetical protein